VSRRLSVNNASLFHMYQHGIYSFDAHTFSMLFCGTKHYFKLQKSFKQASVCSLYYISKT